MYRTATIIAVIQNLLTGALALLLAILEVLCSVALGSRVTRTLRDPIVRFAAALIFGSGLSVMILAVMSWTISVNAALAADMGIAVIAVVAHWKHLRGILVDAGVRLADIAKEAPVVVWALSAILIFYWLNALAPPRDGDVVRYHFAHIAQIARDGKWMPIADYHYALPFGWTLNYLPFQVAHVPQAAHMLNLIAVLVMALTVMSLATASRFPSAVRIAALAFVLHPAVFKAGTTAFADAYAMLVVLIACVLISERDDATGFTEVAFLAGFVSWIGIQSRYQLVAFGIAATLAFVVANGRHRNRAMMPYALGGALALVLASPFYLMNFFEFGNPVWPFFAGSGAAHSYADAVAHAYQQSQTGLHSFLELKRGLTRLVTARDMFPIPIFVVLTVVVGWMRRRVVSMPLLIAATTFVLLWGIAQPALFPRFVLYFFPIALLIALELVSHATAGVARVMTGSVFIAALALGVADVAYAADNLAYLSSGDKNAFHRYTWYYPVYQWANTHTPDNARFAVIVWSGYSYYLDRQYRRADPWLSGEIDWYRVNNAASLDSVLATRRIGYMIYEDRDWTTFKGGAGMMRTIHESIQRGSLIPVQKFHERLYTSRLSRSYLESTVYVLERH